VIINNAASTPIRAQRTNITVENVSATGTNGTTALLRLDGTSPTNFRGRNLYMYDAGSWYLYAADGATGIDISQSMYSGSSGNTGMVFVGSAGGTLSYSIMRPSGSRKMITYGTYAYGIRNNGTGTVNLYNFTGYGQEGWFYYQDGAGTTNISNSYIGHGYKPTIGLIARDAGTVNVTNSILNHFVATNPFQGTIATDSGNIKKTSTMFRSPQKGGFIIPCVDDILSLGYMQAVQPVWSAKGVKGTWFISTSGISDNLAAIEALRATGSVSVEVHGYTHTDTSLTGNAFSITKADKTINIDRTADTITVSDTVTVTGFKAKTLAAIRTELTAGGATVGVLTTNLREETLGEVLADSTGAQASPYTAQLLIDATAATGFYKVEVADSKTQAEALLADYTATTFAVPWGADSTNLYNAVIASGYDSFRYSSGRTTANFDLASINLYRMGYFITSDYLVGATDADTISNTKAFCENVANSGMVIYLLAHSTSEATVEQWGVILDTIQTYCPSITITDAATFVDTVKNGGEWTTADNITYTRTWADLSDFRLKAGSPAINAGTDVGLTTDFAGRPIIGIPDIGAYEHTPSGGSIYNLTDMIL
jgi:hypothetical protein